MDLPVISAFMASVPAPMIYIDQPGSIGAGPTDSRLDALKAQISQESSAGDSSGADAGEDAAGGSAGSAPSASASELERLKRQLRDDEQ